MVKKLFIKEDAYPMDWKPSRDEIDRVFAALDQSGSKNPDFLNDNYGFSKYTVRYSDSGKSEISIYAASDKGDYRFDETFYIYPDTERDTYKISTEELGERTVGKATDVWDIISTCLRKQANKASVECLSKKTRSTKLRKESQESSAAYYDFQEFLGKLTDYVDENNILVDLKGTKFAGDHHDTFEIIVYGAYSNEEITTIILEHSNRNTHNAWTATFDFDGTYDDSSATYIDDLYDVVTEWLDEIAKSAYNESINEKINGKLKNDTEYGFYLQKSYKKEYFFVSSARAKTQKLVAKIISYAYGVSEADVLDVRSKNANDYKYIANKIEPAKITFKQSDKWGDYVDIEGTKSQFSLSNMDKDDTPEIEIVYL